MSPTRRDLIRFLPMAAAAAVLPIETVSAEMSGPEMLSGAGQFFAPDGPACYRKVAIIDRGDGSAELTAEAYGTGAQARVIMSTHLASELVAVLTDSETVAPAPPLLPTTTPGDLIGMLVLQYRSETTRFPLPKRSLGPNANVEIRECADGSAALMIRRWGPSGDPVDLEPAETVFLPPAIAEDLYRALAA